MASMKCYRPADHDPCYQPNQHHNVGHPEPQYHSDGGYHFAGNTDTHQLMHSQSQLAHHGHGKMMMTHHQQEQYSSNFSGSNGHDGVASAGHTAQAMSHGTHAQTGFKSGHENSGNHKAVNWGHAQTGFKSGHDTAGHHKADNWGHETAGHHISESHGNGMLRLLKNAATTHGHAEQQGSHGVAAAAVYYKGNEKKVEKKCSSSEIKMMKTKNVDHSNKVKKNKKDKKNKKCGKDSGSSSSSSDSD